jgi:hypothetical protein
METTHAFTKKALSLKTPIWAKNVFRVTMLLTSALTIYVAGTALIIDFHKVEIMLVLKVIDALVFGLSKLIGIEITDENK